MAGRLDGKVALVTGASQGIGEAIARLFAAEGARVVLGDLLDAQGEKLAAELGAGARYLHLDVTQPVQWAGAVERTLAGCGALDALVNNAGIGLAPAAITARRLEDHQRILDVNLNGVYHGVRAVAPAMSAAGRGSIVNISSIDGIIGVAGLTSYVSSKFAVRGMTKSAALELGRRGVRVNSIHPGFIDTPMLAGAPGDFSAKLREVLDRQPIQRLGTPREVAYLALYLASDESSYCTGAEFTIDGGHTAGAYRWDI
jgi:3alpha(or 20beta)-hydroxysteroid dehydrogenase